MTVWPVLILLLLTAYLLGAIPFCFLIGKLYGVDIRTIGSGNVGGTNLRRGLAGKPLAGFISIIGILLDALKGYTATAWLPALLITFLKPAEPLAISAEWLPIVGGVAAVLGHSFTVLLRFRGGKGVATGAGMFLALCWPATLAGLALFLIVLALTRIMSLASLVGAATVPIASAVYYHYTSTIEAHAIVLGMMIVVDILVFIRHRGNIRRMLQGVEPRLGEPAAPVAAPPQENNRTGQAERHA